MRNETFVSPLACKEGERDDEQGFSDTVVRHSSQRNRFTRCEGPADHGHSGFTERDDHNRWQTTPAAASEIRWSDPAERQGLQAVVAAARGAAEGCAEYPAHYDG